MIIQKREMEVCPTCHLASGVKIPEIIGCDNCRKKIVGDEYVNVWIHYQDDGNSQKFIFCNWKCLIENIKLLDDINIDFITLPHMSIQDFKSLFK
jgi:hypothetical protein